MLLANSRTDREAESSIANSEMLVSLGPSVQLNSWYRSPCVSAYRTLRRKLSQTRRQKSPLQFPIRIYSRETFNCAGKKSISLYRRFNARAKMQWPNIEISPTFQRFCLYLLPFSLSFFFRDTLALPRVDRENSFLVASLDLSPWTSAVWFIGKRKGTPTANIPHRTHARRYSGQPYTSGCCKFSCIHHRSPSFLTFRAHVERWSNDDENVAARTFMCVCVCVRCVCFTTAHRTYHTFVCLCVVCANACIARIVTARSLILTQVYKYWSIYIYILEGK